MILLVTGGRHYSKVETLSEVLTWYHKRQPVNLVIHGACYLGGADQLAENWAKVNHVPYLGIPAGDLIVNPSKGPLRNEAMAKIARGIGEQMGWPVRCVAFPGGRGTESMCKIAEEHGIKVKRVL